MALTDVSLVSRVTENCNLACKYCYMDEKNVKTMSPETARALIRGFVDHNQDFAHFTWIGGEPLTRPDSFYEGIIEESKRLGAEKPSIQISHSIQTNGLALSSERAKHLKGLGYKIGVSYDGSSKLQNELRPTKNDKPVAQIIERNLREVPKQYGLISVITRKSLDHEEEIYNNLKGLTRVARLNFYAPSGEGLTRKDDLLPSKEEALQMFSRFYHLWRDDSSGFVLEPFQDMAQALATGMPKTCEFSAIRCYQIVGSNTEGDIFTCSRSTHDPKTRLGNIFENPLEEILKSHPRTAILQRHLKLRGEKKDCKYFEICSGGCPVEASSHTKDMKNSTYYCCEVKGGLYSQIEQDWKDGKLERKFRV